MECLYGVKILIISSYGRRESSDVMRTKRLKSGHKPPVTPKRLVPLGEIGER